jgi:hypothetical protein
LAYAKHLVKNYDKHQANLDKITHDLDVKTGARSEERFWSAVSACAIYGGIIAAKLGLIKFDVAAVYKWLTTQVRDMQEDKADHVVGQLDVFGQMLDDLAGGALVCSNNNSALASIIKEPRGAVTYRLNTDTETLFIPRSIIKRYVEKHYGSYSELRDEMVSCGALVSDYAKKVLGANTFIGGTQQPCWHVDLKCPALGRNTVALVKSLADSKQEEMVV